MLSVEIREEISVRGEGEGGGRGGGGEVLVMTLSQTVQKSQLPYLWYWVPIPAFSSEKKCQANFFNVSNVSQQ